MSRTKRKVPHDRNFRRPKTQAEKRLAAASSDQEVPVRPKRNPKNLPDTYDDKLISARYEEKLDL